MSMANPLISSKIIDAAGANNMTGTAIVLSGPRPLDMWQVGQGTIEIQITGTPNGTLTLEGSDSYDPIGNPSAVFVPLSALAMTPVLPPVVGAALSYLGALVPGQQALGCRWLRLRYVNASSTGQLNAWFTGTGP